MNASPNIFDKASSPVSPARRQPRNQWLIVCGILACLFAVGLVVAAWGVLSRPRGHKTVSTPSQTSPPATDASASNLAPSAQAPFVPTDDVTLIDDDGQTLWVSPTAGRPLDVSLLPPGTQIILALRPADWIKNPQATKMLNALGPFYYRVANFIPNYSWSSDWYQVFRLLIGLQIDRDGEWVMTRVYFMPRPFTENHVKGWGKGFKDRARSFQGQTYWVEGDLAYFVPVQHDSSAWIVAPEKAIREIIDLGGNPPPLRRDIERLLAHTDSDRHVTVLFAPNSLFSDGQTIFVREFARLREPLFWFLGDEFTAAALSVHCDDNLFIELLATPTLDTSPERASHILAERVAQIPDLLEEYVVDLNPNPYGRRVVARFPDMVRKLAAYTRRGFEADHAVLRCYLPAIAGHNLLMGAELTLAEPPAEKIAADATSSASPPAEVPRLETIDDRLQRRTSLAFGRETLEAALEQLSQDIGVEIIILGADLQAEGITKNQSFGIGIANKPAGEILVEILRLANPDKTATSPKDPRQKLVYVIQEEVAGKSGQIVITTRARSAERGDQLPTAFREN
jgi:hypothetical protein